MGFLLVRPSAGVCPGEGEGAVVVIVGFGVVLVGGASDGGRCFDVEAADWEAAACWERFLRLKRPRRPRLTWARASGARFRLRRSAGGSSLADRKYEREDTKVFDSDKVRCRDGW